jgi:hypothetical protein
MQDRQYVDERPDRVRSGPDPAFTGGPGKSSLPALAIFLAGIIGLGSLGGWFLAPRAADAPMVAMVSSEDVPDAITTLSAEAIPNARSDSRECRFPMGFITVATPGNPAGGTISFRTSKYQSPPFHVTDKPQRIAIPHPLPETGGVDLLSADGEAKGLVVALYPAARLQPVNGTATVKVIWRPRPPCKS